MSVQKADFSNLARGYPATDCTFYRPEDTLNDIDQKEYEENNERPNLYHSNKPNNMSMSKGLFEKPID
jgi:hypothetical protein